MSLEKRIKEYMESLKSTDLGVKGRINVGLVKRLGQGTSNLNYLVELRESSRKFVFRMNMDPKLKHKSKKEFMGLRLVEDICIGPRAYLYDESKGMFDSDFLILDYIEGETIDKSDIYLKDKMVVGLAKLMARMHSIRVGGKLKKMRIDSENPDKIFKIITKYLNYIKKNVSDNFFLIMLKETLNRVKKGYRPHKNLKYVVSQGDFCEQNVIYHKGQFRLIDFEDLGLRDPSYEIAKVMIDFGRPFAEEQRKLFLKEYQKIKRIESIGEIVDNLTPVIYFTVFLWSVWHALRIKNKEFNKNFQVNNNILRDIGYIKTMFKRNLGAGVIDEHYKDRIDFEKVLVS